MSTSSCRSRSANSRSRPSNTVSAACTSSMWGSLPASTAASCIAHRRGAKRAKWKPHLYNEWKKHWVRLEITEDTIWKECWHSVFRCLLDVQRERWGTQGTQSGLGETTNAALFREMSENAHQLAEILLYFHYVWITGQKCSLLGGRYSFGHTMTKTLNVCNKATASCNDYILQTTYYIFPMEWKYKPVNKPFDLQELLNLDDANVLVFNISKHWFKVCQKMEKWKNIFRK